MCLVTEAPNLWWVKFYFLVFFQQILRAGTLHQDEHLGLGRERHALYSLYVPNLGNGSKSAVFGR
jgi:hypothetical protein